MMDAARDAGTRRRIVVGVDDSSGGLSALQWAVRQARSSKSQLVAVRSWALGLPRHGGRRHRRKRHSPVVLRFPGNEQRKESAEIVRQAFRSAIGDIPRDVGLVIETPEGDPGMALADIATAEGDVLVVGTRPGRSLKRLVHGSVSRYCSVHARCPVVVIRAAAENDGPTSDAEFMHYATIGSDTGQPVRGQS
jgi:nucleotide-binding universal stress UspA family protein